MLLRSTSSVVALSSLALVACTDDAAESGLMVVLAQDGSLAPDSLRLKVTTPASDAVRERTWRVPAEATLPGTVRLDANGHSVDRIVVEGSLWHKDALLDLRQVTVTDVPSSRVATVELLFGASCQPTVQQKGSSGEDLCPDGKTCDPRTGACTANAALRGDQLPDYRQGAEDDIDWTTRDVDAGDTAAADADNSNIESSDSAGTSGIAGGSSTATNTSAATNTSTATQSGDDHTSDASAPDTESTDADTLTSSTSADLESGTSEQASTEPSSAESTATETNTSLTATEGPDGATSSVLFDAGADADDTFLGNQTTTDAALDAAPDAAEPPAACTQGSYRDNDMVCQPWSECDPGTYMTRQGSAESNRECEPCDTGTFTDLANETECSVHQECGWQTVLADGTPSQDRSCDPVDVAFQFGSDEYEAVASFTFDDNGNLWAVGATEGALIEDQDNAGAYDAFIQKRNAAGEQTFIEQVGTDGHDQAVGVVNTANGTVTVGGYTEGELGEGGGELGDVFLRRYDATTNEVAWTKEYGTSAIDMTRAITADAAGEMMYVTGYTWGNIGRANAGVSDFFITQFDVNGDPGWEEQWGTDTDEEGMALTVDSEGAVIAVGYTGGALFGDFQGSYDAVVVKMNANGSSAWDDQIGTDAIDIPFAVAVDAEDNVYVAGRTTGEMDPAGAQMLPDAWVSKWTKGGLHQWTRQFGTDGEDAARGLTVFDDTLYVVGYLGRRLTAGAESDENAFISLFSLEGTDQRIRTFGSPEGDEWAYDVKVFKGNVYISGDTSGDLVFPNLGVYDAFLAQVVAPL